jgi:hypothetical protein
MPPQYWLYGLAPLNHMYTLARIRCWPPEDGSICDPNHVGVNFTWTFNVFLIYTVLWVHELVIIDTYCSILLPLNYNIKRAICRCNVFLFIERQCVSSVLAIFPQLSEFGHVNNAYQLNLCLLIRSHLNRLWIGIHLRFKTKQAVITPVICESFHAQSSWQLW